MTNFYILTLNVIHFINNNPQSIKHVNIFGFAWMRVSTNLKLYGIESIT